tara:strand:+ start:10315 stop:11130 length:816 start_codon:yes stop_codon:yes gene_type:complete
MSKLLDAGRSERGWHRIQNAIRCLRLYAWKEIEDLPFTITAPLVKGSLLHIALAHHYQRIKEIQTGGNPDDWLLPEDAIFALAEKNAEESPLWRECAPQLVDSYFRYRNNWLGEDWKVLEVEKELRARVGKEKYLYTQRADLIIEDHNERVWIVDHKSAYRITSKTLRMHILDGQFIGYQLFGYKTYGERFAGVLVNRVQLAPPYGHDRRSLEPAPAALEDFIAVIQEAEERISKYEGRPPREWPMALNNQTCFGKYGQCSAYKLCQFGGE